MPTVLVTGATGQQGGAVVQALLASHHRHPDLTIRALTRNPNSANAQKLVADAAAVQASSSFRIQLNLVKGDLADGDSLAAALAGCNAAFLVTDFRGPDDVAGEIQQGRLFVDRARDAHLPHLIFSSVAGADLAQLVEHFYSKFQIEEYIRSSSDGLRSWTVVRPAGFMEVLPPAGLGRAFMLGAFAATLGAKTRLPYVACEDIGRMAAKALLEPERFRGQVINLAGDRLDVDELQAALERGEGGLHGWRAWLPGWLVLVLSPYHYRQMFRWLALGLQPGDPAECRQILGSMLTVEEWARKQKEKADAAAVAKTR